MGKNYLKEFRVYSQEEAAAAIEAGETTGEKMKVVASLIAPVEAYCAAFKDAIRDLIVSEQANESAKDEAGRGHTVTEAKVMRLARCSQDYKDAALLYQDAKELQAYLSRYAEGLRMDHEHQIAMQYRTSAEIKANTFATGR